MLLVRGTHLINVLAPKTRNFLTSISQTDAPVSVKTGKSEHSSLTGSLFVDNTRRVSLDTTSFTERMSEI
jgi:hypothetical protein